MIFTSDGNAETYTIYKQTIQDVLEGKGNFNRGNARELVIEAQLCSAFNRGVITQFNNFNKEEGYYKNKVANYYSGFSIIMLLMDLPMDFFMMMFLIIVLYYISRILLD